MKLPRFHSCTWSDAPDARRMHSKRPGPSAESPASLADKELHLWVTYPAAKEGKGKHARLRRESPKLWAVMLIETVQQTGPFSYEVTMKRIFKRDDRTIRVWVCNDPDDQSDEAGVFGFLSPQASLLTSLERT